LKYLDRFDKENMFPILEQNYYIVKKLRKIIDETNVIKKIDEKNQSEKTQMEFEINEIEKAGLIAGEDEDLENQRRILNNAESIYMNTNMGYAILRGNDETENIALIDQLNSLKECIENLSEIDDNYNAALQSIISAASELDDLAYTLRDYSDQIDFDMGQLNQIEGRLNLITNLKRKYGYSIEEILSYYHELKVSLEKIENKSEHLGKLLEEYKNEYDRYTEQCKKITGKRFGNKEIFEKKIENEFTDLGMVNGKISVDITQEERISSSGQDNVEFLISLNPGVPPKPLINIASGGEISRIMLALKTILSEADAIPTMVFDEIDTGISGKMAQIVGEKIYGLSRQHQLICITHLPQIASFADQHIEVKKEIKDNLTETSFIRLDNQLKIEAIARMLGGVEITDTTIKHAEEMIVQAAEIKQ
jgi:DNA repair protein RecN (Recombination protein N)